MFLVVLCFCEFARSWWLLGTFSQSHASGSHGSIAIVLLYMCGWLRFYVLALGPVPTGVSVSPSGCQALRVTWTHHAPTLPLTLNHYRVRYQPQGSPFRSAITSSEGSYTITGLAPATTYTVVVDAQTQLGYGYFCCTPTVRATTHNGEGSSDACMATTCYMYVASVSHITKLMYSMHVICTVPQKCTSISL